MTGVRQRKARRRATKSKLSRKVHRKIQVEKRRVLDIPSNAVAAKWDRGKTLRQNFAALGLAVDPNYDLRRKTKQKKLYMQEPVGQDSVIQELEDEAAEAAAVPKVRYCPSGEMIFIHELIEKHGSDYVAMAKDHKINTYQHTPKQLERKCAKYVTTIEHFARVKGMAALKGDNEEEEEA